MANGGLQAQEIELSRLEEAVPTQLMRILAFPFRLSPLLLAQYGVLLLLFLAVLSAGGKQEKRRAKEAKEIL